MSDFDIRDVPDAAFIETARALFDTDLETDELLTRKLRRRADGPYRHPDFDEMASRLHRMIASQTGESFSITGLQWLTGGSSKIQMVFDLHSEGASHTSERLVLRMDPAESSNTTSRAREAELITALQGVVPLPQIRWVDEDATWFPQPAIVYTHVPGVTKPTRSAAGAVVGLGTRFGPALRRELAPQFLEHLAAIHNAHVNDVKFRTMTLPRPGMFEATLWQLERSRRIWFEDRLAEDPVMDVAARWLRDALPPLDHVSVVHGDYRSGNFLFDEESGRITAWLDWERGHLGDRHRDLAWMTQRHKGHYDEDGTYLVCGLIPLDEFYDRYEAAAGLPVLPDRLRYFQVLNCYQVLCTVTATALRVAKLGKSHQDVLLCRLRGLAPVVSAELHELLGEVLR